LITADAYQQAVARTILIGPLFETDPREARRLGPQGEVLYSALDARTDHPLADAFKQIEQRFQVHIVYGRRSFERDGFDAVSPHDLRRATLQAEVVLIDVRHVDRQRVNAFKARLWERFAIDSASYEHVWGYEEWVRLAEPAIEVIRALGGLDEASSVPHPRQKAAEGGAPVRGEGGTPGSAGASPSQCVLLAHEFMGMPTALAAVLHEPQRMRTIFYAHEVAPMRKIVEEHPGHDAMFYNVLRRALPRGHYVDDLFGSQAAYFKYPLVKAAHFCDAIFAVGDYVAEELRFIGPEFSDARIALVYNGVPAMETSYEQNQRSKRLLRTYAEGLLGVAPNHVFTRVTRLIRSKGLWRDVQVLEQLERRFRETGQTAVMFFLACEVPRRPNADIWQMEARHDWPVAHREGPPDLTPGEAEFYVRVQAFNARARQVKIVFVNQFGWSHETCGARMPEEMEFWDIRRGSDVEFGQSVYEPFGIAQVEALAFGGICVFSSVCGCAGFVNRVLKGGAAPNVVIADYTRLPPSAGGWSDLDILKLPERERQRIEQSVVAEVADSIVRNLPRDEADERRMLHVGSGLARQMSWEVVVRDYFLPGIQQVVARPQQAASEPALA
jgi:hypothetical protein